MSEALRIVVRGRVQGVGYRAWAVATARDLGLAGWVRNRRDGSVEILAAGSAAALEELVRACRHGPPAARVACVEARPDDPPGAAGFLQLLTE